MAKPQQSRASIRWGAFLCAAGFGLMFLPQELSQMVRTQLRDFAGPGLGIVRTVTEPFSQTLSGIGQGRRDRDENLRLQKELAALSRNARLAFSSPPAASASEESRAVLGATPSEPLLIPELIEARVVGEETAAPWRQHKLLGVGREKGLEESLFVLDGSGPLIDQGTSVRVDVNDSVYAGRVVVGRVAKVGTWTSTLQLVTDPNFHGLACIMREMASGWLPGAEGILSGDGEGYCRLEVESAEPVRVGDAVCTVPDDGVLPLRMYYGRVAEVELKPGSLHWQVRVEPALKEIPLRSVAVLRTKLNPNRILANRSQN